MAAIAAAVAAASAAFSTLCLTRPSTYSRHPTFRILSPRVRCSLPSAASSAEEFNITSAPNPRTERPKPSSPIDDEVPPSGQLFIPWIVRGPDGNLTLQSHPPARLLHAMDDAKTKKKKGGAEKVVEEPKHSKAARRFYNDRFREPPQRLSKVLATAGVASRRSSEDLIFEGRVTVNGSVCTIPQTKVDPTRDVIYVNGNRLSKKLPPKVYLALNKPKGYICSSGGKEFNSVMGLFDDYLKSWDKRKAGQQKPRLFTVGRLDVATSGLIIVTNDGEFAQKISHPSSNLTKEYIATIDGEVHKRHLIAISEGTIVDGVHCTPDSVELLPRQPDLLRPRIRLVLATCHMFSDPLEEEGNEKEEPLMECDIVAPFKAINICYLKLVKSPHFWILPQTVHEGRNHEVRDLVRNAGLQMHSLKRTRIGGFRLPSHLGLGKHVELKQSDLKALGWTR